MPDLRRFRHLFALLLGAAGLAALVSPSSAAPPGFAFLEIPAGARASGMGGAYASQALGLEAAFWNPAGLARAKGTEVVASHAELDQGLHYDAVGLGGRLWGGGFGLTLRALYSEAIESRDELGNLTGSFGSHDLEFALSYGAPVGGGFELGGSAQLVRERLAEVAAMTQAYGLGVAWQPPGRDGLRLSAGVRNLGPAARYTFDGLAGEDIALPAALHGGAAMTRAIGHGLTVRGALEGRFTRGRTGLGAIGAEVTNLGGASLRAGWRVNDAATDFSLGAGFQARRMQFDYAFVPLDLNLGESHRFSVRMQF